MPYSQSGTATTFPALPRKRTITAASLPVPSRDGINPDALYRVRQIVPHIIPISPAGWWLGVKAGRYPKPIKLGARTTCWRGIDLIAFLEKAGEGDSR